MKSQLNLFSEMPPPADKPLKFAPAHRPVWTENKAKLIERYLFYFVLITKHGTYIDGFAGPQRPNKPEMWAAKLDLESKPQLLRHFYLFDVQAKQVQHLNALCKSQPSVSG